MLVRVRHGNVSVTGGIGPPGEGNRGGRHTASGGSPRDARWRGEGARGWRGGANGVGDVAAACGRRREDALDAATSEAPGSDCWQSQTEESEGILLARGGGKGATEERRGGPTISSDFAGVEQRGKKGAAARGGGRRRPRVRGRAAAC